MLSQAVEYSLRAMVLLAQHSREPLTVQTIASTGKIPAPYLAKLLQGLTRGGLVSAQRGVGGGYVLAKSPAKITLADVVNVVDPLQRINECPLGISGHVSLCPLHRRMDQAMADVERAFVDTTLADICNESSGSIPLCSTHTVKKLGVRRES